MPILFGDLDSNICCERNNRYTLNISAQLNERFQSSLAEVVAL